MNCDEAQRRILLADSGELPATEIAQLEGHLSSCRQCRGYKTFSGKVVSDSRASLSVNDPSEIVMTRIRVIAEEQRNRRRHFVFPTPVLQALSYAAAVALIVGGWFLLSNGDSPSHTVVAGHNQQGDMTHLHTIVSLVSEQELEEASFENGLGADQQRLALARRLLFIEGLAAENHDEIEEEENWEIDLLPIDPLSSNSSELHRTTRV